MLLFIIFIAVVLGGLNIISYLGAVQIHWKKDGFCFRQVIAQTMGAVRIWSSFLLGQVAKKSNDF